ncbi:MAG: tetratricopeptide repeat protein, partial [Cyanobacteria bacterium P01_G01_bin.38]
QVEGNPMPVSDYFAIGRTIIHALTGTHPQDLPFSKQSGQLRSQIVWRDKAPQISPLFADFLDSLAHDNPVYRPYGAERVIKYLNSIPRRARQQAILNSKYFKFGVPLAVGLILTLGAHFGWTTYTQLRASQLLAVGNQLQAVGNHPNAISVFESALNLQPKRSQIHASLALSYSLSGEPNKAISAFQTALSLDPDNQIAHYNLANIYEQTNELESAIIHYKLAAQPGSPTEHEANNNLARLYIRDGQLDTAEQLIKAQLERVQTQDTKDTKAALYKNLGWISIEKNDLDIALDFLNQSLELDPQRTDTYCLLAITRQRLGQEAEADRTTCFLMQTPPGQPEIQEWKALLLDS